MFIFLLIYFQKRAQLKTRTVVFMAVIVLLLGTFQIQTYLMNVNAPRYLFFYYGGKTANTYFPLGSGFATFGSDQAARNYSRLYYQYGFALIAMVGCMSIDILAQWMLKPFRKAALKMLGDIINISQKIFICY